VSAPSYFIRAYFNRAVVGLTLLLCVLIWDGWVREAAPGPALGAWAVPAWAAQTGRWVLQGKGQIPMPQGAPSAHASTLLAMPEQHPSSLLAFWFAGSRESGPDVQIAMSTLSRATGQWSEARFVLSREEVGQQLGHGKRRLGNPVAWLDGTGRLHLFVVATGLGGWAASRILHVRQTEPAGDRAQDFKFEVVRVLPLSWLWNTSHLVRAAPLRLQDGGMLLPAYFELGKKYPVALRFDAAGGFLGMVQMSQRGHVLQPTLVLQTPSHWLALMRDNSQQGKIAVAETHDGGQSWSDLPDLPLNNPGTSVAALSLAPGKMVLAHNSQPHDRTVLDLSQSADGLHWQLIANLARGSGRDEYSYPALAWANGSLWVSYTDQRRTIAWQQFVFEPGPTAALPQSARP
jgi:predicted neuraminidase